MLCALHPKTIHDAPFRTARGIHIAIGAGIIFHAGLLHLHDVIRVHEETRYNNYSTKDILLPCPPTSCSTRFNPVRACPPTTTTTSLFLMCINQYVAASLCTR